MRHLNFAIPAAAFILVSATIGQAQNYGFKPCFEKKVMEVPGFVMPVKERPAFDKTQLEKASIESSQMYTLDRVKPEWEKSSVEKPGFENRCPPSAPLLKPERTYTTQSATTVALKRKDLNYRLPSESQVWASQKTALKKIKPGSLAASSSCYCATPSSRAPIGSGTGLVSVK